MIPAFIRRQANGAAMKTVSYKDPYEKGDVVVEIEEDKNLDDSLSFISEDTRKTQNLERKERYHNICHLSDLKYEGTNYASDIDLEAEFLREEQERIIDDWLRENLTLTQYRRFKYLMEGLSIREIAELEGIDYKSARESITAARKKLQKLYHDTPSNTPL